MDRCRRPKIPGRSEGGVVNNSLQKAMTSGASGTTFVMARTNHMMRPNPSKGR